MTEVSSPGSAAEREQPDPHRNQSDGQAVYVGSEIHRRISVRSSSKEPTTFVATVRQGKVWVSIVPLFIGEVILDPEKVDAVIRTLAQARDDARRMGRKNLSDGKAGG